MTWRAAASTAPDFAPGRTAARAAYIALQGVVQFLFRVARPQQGAEHGERPLGDVDRLADLLDLPGVLDGPQTLDAVAGRLPFQPLGQLAERVEFADGQVPA